MSEMLANNCRRHWRWARTGDVVLSVVSLEPIKAERKLQIRVVRVVWRRGSFVVRSSLFVLRHFPPHVYILCDALCTVFLLSVRCCVCVCVCVHIYVNMSRALGLALQLFSFYFYLYFIVVFSFILFFFWNR